MDTQHHHTTVTDSDHPTENARSFSSLVRNLLTSGRNHWRYSYRWWLVLNLLLATAVVSWLFLDARFEASLDWWKFQSSETVTQLEYHAGDWWWLRFRNAVLMTLVTVAGLGAVTMVFHLLLGSPVNRGIQAVMSLVTIVAVWLAIGTHWEDIAWQGKQFRLRYILSEFDAATQTLRSDWPDDDGELKGLGPFMAYPVGRPRTLLMLTLPQMEKFPGSFASVEGEPGGPYRFELVANEEGDWLEWHPQGSYPKTFRGGLGELYRLQKSQPLQNGWHLARYSH